MSKQNTNITELDFISLAEIANDTPYSQEYLSLRARQGKLRAVKIKRTWMTRKDWMADYIEKKSWDKKKSVYKEMAPSEEPTPAPVLQDVPTPNKPAEEPVVQESEESPVQVPQPPTQDDSVAEKLGAVFAHLKKGMVPKVLEGVMVTSLVLAMVIMTAFTIQWGLDGAPSPQDSGIANIPTKIMDTFVFAVQDARTEWDKSMERIEAKKIIAQQQERQALGEQGQVAGVRIEAEDEEPATSTLEAFSGQIDIFVSHVVDTLRLDSGR